MPKISVILPIYNSRAFIADAIDSVLGQNAQDFELILIDDASSDGTSAILETLSDPRVHHIRHATNQGLVYSLNEGLQLATGEFIARMDHDDIALPERFARQLAFLEHHPNVGVVGSGYRLIDGAGVQGLGYRPPATHDEISWAMCFLCPMAHPTIMARRTALLAAGGYRQSAYYAEDYDLWERLSREVQFANLPEPLLLLRKHGGNMSNVWLSKNIAVAIGVAARRISFLLDEEIDHEVVHCLYTQGHVHSQRVGQARALVMRLVRMCAQRYPSASGLIRRDAAVRIAQMGLRSRRPGTALASLAQATALAPSFAGTIFNKLKSRLAKQGDLPLIG
jgi:glycosyltransferase involved in cell wall biosynthesis